MVTKEYNVTGMHCSSCSMLIEMTLADIEGIESAEVNHANGVTKVVLDENTVDDASIIAAIKGLGYDAVVA